ncbi:MAG: nucleotidyltransferase [Acetatifactor sp.]
MKVNGIIAEYNPFHNGHLYQLKQSKEATESDYTVVVMSGNFTQRGDVAFCEKHVRTQMALQNGADLVIELPAVFATSSAWEFAFGGVSILNSLGVVDTLSFGSECGDLEKLTQIAEILLEEPEEYRCILTKCLSEGMSFPVARDLSVGTLLLKSPEETSELLSNPNNILGLEYLKALKTLHSSISPYTVQRIESGYHEETLGETISSATAIRKALIERNDLTLLQDQLPKSALSLLSHSLGEEYKKLNALLSGALYQKLYWEQEQGYTAYLDVTTSLSDRIRNRLVDFQDLDSFSLLLKTKEMTLTRIRRSLLHILLNIKARDLPGIQTPKPVPYARVLGFRKDAKPLLSEIKRHSSIPFITKPADAGEQLDGDALGLFRQDIEISQFYLGLLYQVRGRKPLNEYTIPIVIE